MFLAFPTSSLKKKWQSPQQSPVIHPRLCCPAEFPAGSTARCLPLAESDGPADVATAASPHVLPLPWQHKVTLVLTAFHRYRYPGQPPERCRAPAPGAAGPGRCFKRQAQGRSPHDKVLQSSPKAGDDFC